VCTFIYCCFLLYDFLINQEGLLWDGRGSARNGRGVEQVQHVTEEEWAINLPDG
jgi:hypothetical protein